MKRPATGAALAGLGLLLANGATLAEPASAAALSADSSTHTAMPGTNSAVSSLESAASGADAQFVTIQGQRTALSSAQIAAYHNLSASLHERIAGDDGQIAMTRPHDTIMCPW